jgi:glyoxylase-like metal-dependent hydrolase (beta-lactamase superfamily II)
MGISKIGNAQAELDKAIKINAGEVWFEVTKLPNDVYSIAEPGHWQHVISFLVLGSTKALLFDTGMGIGDIRKVVMKLTNIDIIVVNSHTHFDHIGDDWRFSAVYLYADERAVETLKNGYTHDALLFDSNPECFVKPYPLGFDPNKYVIQPVPASRIHRLCNGDCIDLGNRKVEVLHTPGHTDDSITLFDRENRALFTGDTFYPSRLFAFMNDDQGSSNLIVYEQTVKELTKLVPELDYLYPGHKKPLVNPNILKDVARAFESVNTGKAQYRLEELYSRTLRLYEFDGFSIVTLDET